MAIWKLTTRGKLAYSLLVWKGCHTPCLQGFIWIMVTGGCSLWKIHWVKICDIQHSLLYKRLCGFWTDKGRKQIWDGSYCKMWMSGDNLDYCFHVGCCWVAKSSLALCNPPWTAACQNPLSFTISQSLLKLMSIEPVIPSNHSHSLLSPSPPAFNPS